MMSKVLAFCLGAVITGSIIGVANIIYDAIMRKVTQKKTEEKIHNFFEDLKENLKEEE